MNKIRIFGIILLALFLAVSGCNKGPTGPAGEPGLTVFMAEFQAGVYPDTDYDGNDDTNLYEETPDTNYEGNYQWVGMIGGYRERRLLRFDLSYIPAAANVTQAYLTLYCNETDGAGSPSIAVYKVLNDWAAHETTWNSRYTGALWSAPGGDFDPVPVSPVITVDSVRHYSWQINPAVVQAWLDNSSQNYGLLVRDTVESTTVQEDAAFDHNVSADAEKRPKLTVYYTLE